MILLSACLAAIPASAAGLDRTFKLIKEGEQLTAAAAADLEAKVAKRPRDLESRLRLLSYYAGPQDSPEVEAIRAARLRHSLWIIENEPKAAVFNIGTRIYAVQPVGDALADPAGWQSAKAAWESQLARRPKDMELKKNAASYVGIHDFAFTERQLKEAGEFRWLGQLYAKSILGISAYAYRSSDPAQASDALRSSEHARYALAELERSANAALLGGAGFTLCRDGGILYADGKLDWDYTPLAERLLAEAARLDPLNDDAFSEVPVLPRRGERYPMKVRLGGTVAAANLRRQVLPVIPKGTPPADEPVRLKILIGLDGTIIRAVPVSGPALYREPAVRAVKQWVYQPVTVNGKPTFVLTSVDLIF